MKKGCIALFSGGLDSALAALIMSEQDLKVYALKFTAPFFSKPLSEDMLNILKKYNIELLEKKVDESYMKLVIDPKYGRGKNMNPCIDCRVYMYSQAAKLFDNTGTSFIVTGDVIGQRPMTQNKHTLYRMEKEAGLKNLVLRPLTALKLRKTIPETEGIVDRSRLYGICGRGRKAQYKLAEHFYIKNIPQPAGGCLLTDIDFSKKLKHSIEAGENSFEDVELLKVGRFFRHISGSRLVIARNESESNYLWNKECDNIVKLRSEKVSGAAGILIPKGSLCIEEAASAVAYYGKGRDTERVDIFFKTGDSSGQVAVKPAEPKTIGFELI